MSYGIDKSTLPHGLWLWLMRHGETPWNRDRRLQGRKDVPLNACGRSQAREASQYLRDSQITSIYSSPLSRAKETANIIADERGMLVEVERDLAEISHGDWEGLRPEDIPDYDLWKHNPKACDKPNGESLIDFEQRVVNAFEKIFNRHRDEPSPTVLVVAHQVTIQVFLCQIAGVDVEHFWYFEQDNCALNLITYDNEGVPTLKASNIVCWKPPSAIVAA